MIHSLVWGGTKSEEDDAGYRWRSLRARVHKTTSGCVILLSDFFDDPKRMLCKIAMT